MDFWCAPLAIGCRALQRNVGVVEPHCCCMLWMLGDVWSRSSFLKNQADIYYLPVSYTVGGVPTRGDSSPHSMSASICLELSK